MLARVIFSIPGPPRDRRVGASAGAAIAIVSIIRSSTENSLEIIICHSRTGLVVGLSGHRHVAKVATERRLFLRLDPLLGLVRVVEGFITSFNSDQLDVDGEDRNPYPDVIHRHPHVPFAARACQQTMHIPCGIGSEVGVGSV